MHSYLIFAYGRSYFLKKMLEIPSFFSNNWVISRTIHVIVGSSKVIVIISLSIKIMIF